MFFFVMGEFYLIIILRHLQDAGTSFLLQGIFLAVAIVISITWVFSDATQHGWNAAYYSSCTLL